MVDQSYMLSRGTPPSASKRYLDQTVLPVIIDLAGDMEAGLERVAVAARGRPALALSVAVLVGATIGRLILRRMTPTRRFIR